MDVIGFATWWEAACGTWVLPLLAVIVLVWTVSVFVFHVGRHWDCATRGCPTESPWEGR
jgi:hypothetical protein